MSVRADANCKVYVHLEDRVELALDVDLLNAFANFTIGIEEGLRIRAHICLIEFDQATQNFSTFGKVDLILLQLFANTYFSSEEYEVLQMLNDRLAGWLTLSLPTDFGGYFRLEKLSVQVHNDYLTFGAAPVFIPPVAQNSVDVAFQ